MAAHGRKQNPHFHPPVKYGVNIIKLNEKSLSNDWYPNEKYT